MLVTDAASADEPRDVTGAPLPGQESGRIDGVDEDDSGWRTVGRGILFVPRGVFEIAFAPIRGGFWAFERYRIRERWYEIFFNEDRTVGIYPTVEVVSGLGSSAGARFVARDLFGRGEHFALRGTAGSYRNLLRAGLRSGRRFAPLTLEIGAEHERRPNDRFYGIGNDDGSLMRYRKELDRALAIADLRLVGDLHLRVAGALARADFESDSPLVQMQVGFDGVRYTYGDIELVWDSRGPYTLWEPPSLDAVGTLASVYAGRFAIEEGGEDFWRYGADAQHYVRLAPGPRVLAARVHAEGVTGEIDEVPFDELPALGGSTLLRGYATDRFRDRVAVLGTLEYRWDLAWYLIANAFVDAGRVAPAFDELSTSDFRVGYGVGIDMYTERSFVLRAHVASSIDGGVYFNLAFDPAFDLDPRVRR